jgi:CRISPR-associated endonuclease/helicase Cas3
MSDGFTLSDDDHANCIGFLAALHDLGKGSPAFQVHPSLAGADVDAIRRRLTDAGLPCPRLRDRRGTSRQVLTPHGAITVFVLPDILTDRYKFSPEAAGVFARSVGAHHGRFATSIDLQAVTSRAAGDGPWHELRLAIVDQLAKVMGAPKRPPSAPDHATAVAIAGFISVADWIGSMERYFPYAILPGFDPEALDFRVYAAESAHRADRAVRELRWLADAALSAATTFESLFPDISPNPLQRAVIDGAPDLREPTLVIVEAPTGEGKTEAAMYLAQHFAARVGQHGCYFALPTQATSNQMFSRVRAFLEKARTGEVNLQLLHGHAALSAEFQTLREKDAYVFPVAVYGDAGPDAAGDEDTSTVVAAEWFTYRKRGLLAPFGVGTVDQALMAVLQTRHYFVRLFGLAGKTVVIDEVHAYDAYMTTLMERLLEWLAALGSSVVLLSATLPSARREALATAYMHGLGLNAQGADSASYPRLTWANARGHNAQPISASERSRRRIRLEWLDAALLHDRIATMLANGGCAAVICNTVGRAQEIYRALKPFFCTVADDGEPELMLFHARYPFEQRDFREKGALVRFGKVGARVDLGEGIVLRVKRPGRAVIVATQVIEQSLDLDFDLMVSEFAPVDLLLQRAGRLHRHERARPKNLAVPRMLLIRPQLRDREVPGFGGGTEAVYDRHILLRSFTALYGREFVDVPRDVEGLIEFVYGEKTACPVDASEAVRKAWAESESDLKAKRERYEGLAKENRIPAPGDESLFEKNAGLDEDSPDVHPRLQALTRLSDGPTVSVVVCGADEFASLDPGGEPSRDEAIALLRREVRIAHRGIASALLSDASFRPRGWHRSPLLRHHRLVRLDSTGRALIGGFEIALDGELGLVFEKAGASTLS